MSLQADGSDCGVFLCMFKAMALERGRLSRDSNFCLWGEDASRVKSSSKVTHVGVLRFRTLMLKRLTAFAVEYTRHWLSQAATAPPPRKRQARGAISIDPRLTILLGLQAKECPRILGELEQHGRKISHWAWWVFPTEKEGESEPERQRTAVTRESAAVLLRRAPESWRHVLEKIRALVAARGALVLPQNDHGRVRHFISFWRGQPDLPAWMNMVIGDLAACYATDAPTGPEQPQVDPVWFTLPRVLREVLSANFQLGILPCPMHLPSPGGRMQESCLPVSALVQMDMRIVDLWGGSERHLWFSEWSQHLGFTVNATLRKNGQLGLNCGNIASYSAAAFWAIFREMHLAEVQSEQYTGPDWMSHPVEIEAAKQELITRSNQIFHRFYTEVDNQGKQNRPEPESNWTSGHPIETARSLTGTEIGILLAYLMGWAQPGDDETHLEESHLLFSNTSWEELIRLVAGNVYKATQTGFQGCQRVLISNDICSADEGEDSHWFTVAYRLSAR